MSDVDSDDRISNASDGDRPIEDDENRVDVEGEEGEGEEMEDPQLDFEDRVEIDHRDDAERLADPSKMRARSVAERVTTPFLTKYERARILGTRALQISMNAPILVQVEGEVDPLRIADKELRDRVLPLKVRRILPDNTYEDWEIKDLEVDPERVADDRYKNM